MSTLRRCNSCGDEKSIESFHKGSGYVGGRRPCCNACRGTKHPEWAAIRIENVGLLKKDRRRCIKCRIEKDVGDFKKSHLTSDKINYLCYPCEREYRRPLEIAHNRKSRLEALMRYGGKCACCDENRFEFLALDHINGNGNKERASKIYKPGGGFVKWLKRMGWPKGYRVLCHNCNQAIGNYGYCPHTGNISK